MKLMKLSVGILFGFLCLVKPVFAYSDRIDAPAAEIYNAALECFAKEGIAKQDSEKKTLTTKWAYTTVRKSHRRLFVPLRMNETVDLRYKMTVEIKDGTNYSDVSVVGWFQEKGTDLQPQMPWKPSGSSRELYFKERDAFFKILNALETRKKSVPA